MSRGQEAVRDARHDEGCRAAVRGLHSSLRNDDGQHRHDVRRVHARHAEEDEEDEWTADEDAALEAAVIAAAEWRLIRPPLHLELQVFSITKRHSENVSPAYVSMFASFWPGNNQQRREIRLCRKKKISEGFIIHRLLDIAASPTQAAEATEAATGAARRCAALRRRQRGGGDGGGVAGGVAGGHLCRPQGGHLLGQGTHRAPPPLSTPCTCRARPGVFSECSSSLLPGPRHPSLAGRDRRWRNTAA